MRYPFPLSMRPALALVFMGSLVAQDTAQAQTYSQDLFSNLEWENIGPSRGGRSTAAAGSDARPLEYYFGASGGGLWKTTDAGTTWNPVTDHQVNSASVGAVQVCEANPDVVYIGMGESEIRGNIQQGDGVYRSDDAGETWRHIGLNGSQAVGRIRIHPENCDIAWAAAWGVHSTPSDERGVYKTTDGGGTWRRVLYRDENTGAQDLVLDATDPDVLYASLWEAWRRSWGMSSGGPGSGLFKSTDGGETWTELTRNPGMPAGTIGKIGVAVSPADPNRVWAQVEAAEGGLFRSDDAGDTWELINDSRDLRQRAFYYTRIYADTQDRDLLYALNVGIYRSTDGGVTLESMSVPHGDNHDLWISPSDPMRMIEANDGGANVSFNAGETWTDQDFPTAQFYRITTTNHFPYHVCGAQQDNSTACVPSRGWDHLYGGDMRHTFLYDAGGGESGYIASNPDKPWILYAGSHSGTLTRKNQQNGQERAINVWPENPMGQSSASLVERVQWTFPIVFSPHDSNVLFTTSQHVWKTTNEGQSFQRISPDLTRAVDSTMIESGGPITKDQTGVEVFATIFALAPSYHDPEVIWAGSDDGLVHVTRNGTAEMPDWADVTPADMPYLGRVNTIEASPNTPGKAYVAVIRYLVENDRAPYIWKTEDYGASWTKIVNGIPADDFIRSVREDPTRPGLLFAASEQTVYVSWDDGANWQSLGMNLPNVQVSDIQVKENDLVIGTHGRSAWVMRDITPIRAMNARVAEADVHLYKPVDTYRNVDPGVQVRYYLAEDSDVKLEFMDENGNVIETYEGDATVEQARPGRGRRRFGGGARSQPSGKAGARTFMWDLRYPGFVDFEGMIFWSGSNQGPVVLPGSYTVRLTAGDEVLEQEFEIKLDPRNEPVTIAQLQAQLDLALEVRDKVTQANQAVIQIRDIEGQVDDRTGRTENPEIHGQADVVRGKLDEVESEIYQVRNESRQDPLNFPIKINNKLAALLNGVSRGDFPPTEQSRQVFERLDGLLQAEMVRLQLIIEQDISRLNELLREAGLDPIEIQKLIS
ncbi:MAG: glycosyl hydrolase [Gemmatimonadota bacterium]|nr:glycosyl hydrolase [Gemmatimonadota bacterium]